MPRTEPRIGCQTTDFQQADSPMAVRANRLQKLDHRGVVDRVPEQAPADHLGQVVIADRQRVGVPERALGDLGRGPLPDARQRHQRSTGLFGRATGQAFQ